MRGDSLAFRSDANLHRKAEVTYEDLHCSITSIFGAASSRREKYSRYGRDTRRVLPDEIVQFVAREWLSQPELTYFVV